MGIPLDGFWEYQAPEWIANFWEVGFGVAFQAVTMLVHVGPRALPSAWVGLPLRGGKRCPRLLQVEIRIKRRIKIKIKIKIKRGSLTGFEGHDYSMKV